MGRFLSGASGSVPRSLRHVFEASNPSFAIPSWARVICVSGVGGGGSGGVRATTGARGGGGGSGAHAIDLPLIIPLGVTTIAVAIGVAGAAVSAAAATLGNAGGATTLMLGSALAVRLNGGGAGQADGLGGPAGIPEIYPRLNITNGGISPSAPWQATQARVVGGLQGGDGSAATGGFGGGAVGHFGLGGAALAAAPSVNTPGGNASGYGAGGAGALWLSGGAVSSGAGTPGILICEFLEALQ